MIKGFLKSKLGQLILISFTVATVIAGVMAWMYENIRIPALVDQRDALQQSVSDLSSLLQQREAKARELENLLKNERATSADRGMERERATLELTQVSNRLVQANERQAELAKTIRETMARGNNSTNSRPVLPFRSLVGVAGDNEEIALLTIHSQIDKLKLLAYDAFRSELDIIKQTGKGPGESSDEHVVRVVGKMGSRMGVYLNFAFRLEDLRRLLTKQVHDHFRRELANADPNHFDEFFVQVRSTAPVIADSQDLFNKLKIDSLSEGEWIDRSLARVASFLSQTNQIPLGIVETSR